MLIRRQTSATTSFSSNVPTHNHLDSQTHGKTWSGTWPKHESILALGENMVKTRSKQTTYWADIDEYGIMSNLLTCLRYSIAYLHGSFIVEENSRVHIQVKFSTRCVRSSRRNVMYSSSSSICLLAKCLDWLHTFTQTCTLLPTIHSSFQAVGSSLRRK